VRILVMVRMRSRKEELGVLQEEHGRRYVHILRLAWQRMLQSVRLQLRWKTKCYE